MRRKNVSPLFAKARLRLIFASLKNEGGPVAQLDRATAF